MPKRPLQLSGGQVWVGISGWTYAPWRGVFYPEELIQRRELEFASRQPRTIEINGTFYSLQKPASYRKWFAETPDGFVFSVKGGQFITHIRRLKDVATPLANFFASGVLLLGPKLGPILWQLPPTSRYDREVLSRFLELLPQSVRDAARLAGNHDERTGSEGLAALDQDRPIRYALEIRHPSFEQDEFVTLLRDHGVALAVADTAGKWPLMEDVTADFLYLRLHGAEELYASGYTDAALDSWAAKIQAWSSGKEPKEARRVTSARESKASARDVYVYFDNDIKVHVPYDAKKLSEKLRLPSWPTQCD